MSFMNSLLETVFAQTATPTPGAGTPLCTSTSFGGAVCNLPQYVSLILNWLVPAAVFLAVIMVMWAGYLYITSAGNQETIKAAKERLLGTLAGLALLLLIRYIYNIVI